MEKDDIMNEKKMMKKKHIIIDIVFFLYLFTTILEKIKWDILTMASDIFTLATIVLFPLLLFYYAIEKKLININKFERKILIYFLVYLLCIILQFFVLDNDSHIVVQYIKGVVSLIVRILSIINIILFLKIDQHYLDFNKISKYLYYITILNVLYCMLQNINPNIDTTLISIFNSDSTRFGIDAYGQLGRVTGLLLESNFNGPFLVFGLVNMVYVHSLYPKEQILYKMICRIFIVLTLIELVLTFSRTAYVGLLVFLVYHFYHLKFKYKWKFLLVSLAAAIVFVYIYISNPSFKEIIDVRFDFFGQGNSIKTDSHYTIMVEAISIYLMSFRNIIFGVGLNCLNIYFQNIYFYEMMKAHNYYLQVLCDTGIIGLSFFFYYIYLLYSKLGKIKKPDKLVRTLILVSLSMNFTYDPISRNYNLFLILFVLAINNSKVITCVNKSSMYGLKERLEVI